MRRVSPSRYQRMEFSSDRERLADSDRRMVFSG